MQELSRERDVLIKQIEKEDRKSSKETERQRVNFNGSEGGIGSFVSRKTGASPNVPSLRESPVKSMEIPHNQQIQFHSRR